MEERNFKIGLCAENEFVEILERMATSLEIIAHFVNNIASSETNDTEESKDQNDISCKTQTNIGKGIRRLRRRKNITQKQFASLLGTSQAGVSQFEHKKFPHEYRYGTLEKIASVFNCDVADLINAPEQETTGDRIKSFRIAKGLSQKELGEIIGGLTQQDISKFETKENPPKIESLKKLSAALDCKIGDLLP